MTSMRNSRWIPIRDRKHLIETLNQRGEGNYLAFVDKPQLGSRHQVISNRKISNGYLQTMMGLFLWDLKDVDVLAILPEDEFPEPDCNIGRDPK